MLPPVDYVSIKGEPFIKCFSAAQAVKIFEQETGHSFSSVALGKLLASADIKPQAKNRFKESVYSGTKCWNFAWTTMVNKTCDNNIYDNAESKLKRDCKVPDCPLNPNDFII